MEGVRRERKCLPPWDPCIFSLGETRCECKPPARQLRQRPPLLPRRGPVITVYLPPPRGSAGTGAELRPRQPCTAWSRLIQDQCKSRTSVSFKPKVIYEGKNLKPLKRLKCWWIDPVLRHFPANSATIKPSGDASLQTPVPHTCAPQNP